MRRSTSTCRCPPPALVLVLMNVATIFPLWPGNIGLLQAAVALPLVQYGVAYGTGFAFGLVLQAVEMSVGVGVGLVFLAREGLSFASLKTNGGARRRHPRRTSLDELPTRTEEAVETRGRGPVRHTVRESSALNAPEPGGDTVSAAAALGAWPVTAATNGSRSSATSSTSVTADDGRRPRNVAEQRDLAEPLAGAERASAGSRPSPARIT